MVIIDSSPAAESASRSEVLQTSNHNCSAVGQIDLNHKYGASAEEVSAVIDSFTKPIICARNAYIKKRMEENSAKVLDVAKNFYELSMERRNSISDDGNMDLLAKRQNAAINKRKEYEDEANLEGLIINLENTSHQINLPEVEKLPKYTTWIFLNRNQRMSHDQSVADPRPIYHDENGKEVQISSDSEEETSEEEGEEEEKNEFVKNEDYVVRETIEELGPCDLVFNLLSERLSRTPAEIKERYEYLIKNDNIVDHVLAGDTANCGDPYIENDLATALDSFDVLFCRHCLVFDCKLHGCPEDLIFPVEKQLKWSSPDVEKEPCGATCHQLVLESFESSNKRLTEVVEKTNWKPFEKAMYKKGIEIFGHNSCLIARNLLSGLKTCSEIFKYMQQSEEISQEGVGMVHSIDGNEAMDGDARGKSRLIPQRGRTRRLGYTSSRHQSRKRIAEQDQLYPHYTPCGCQTACGKNCPCFVNGTCCEKFCGCPKSCKNRYRGCYCAKSHCQSQQCPCFAANRECDPDVCRNCCLSCGEGTLGVPSQRGNHNKCENMKILLRQHQKVFLGRSAVNGWGVFLKNSIGKDMYIGEYTGELISHAEAEKRGKIYDRMNSSFLFNLNSELVIDARRAGNKLKFANHSPNPNCYPKVMLVAGDYCIGIFSKRPIRAGEELFYDYCYDVGTEPPWMKKPNAPGSTSNKRVSCAPSRGCNKKHI